jgi:ribosomal protein S27AE
MSQQSSERKCPACGGKNLAEGKFGVYKHTFIPKRRFMMLGYIARASACLDCGFLAHYLDESDLEDIRRQA